MHWNIFTESCQSAGFKVPFFKDDVFLLRSLDPNQNGMFKGQCHEALKIAYFIT